MKKRYLAIFLVVLLLYNVSAYSGVSPGTYSMDFEANAERVFDFNFLGEVDSSYETYLDGDLAKYGTLSVDEVNGGGSVRVLLELPDSLEPGPHVLFVGARQDSSVNGISVTANVRGQVIVNVPYPGKYAKMQFFVEDAAAGEDVKMKAIIDNLGEEEVNFEPIIKVYDNRGKFLEEFNLGAFKVESLKKEEIYFDMDTTPYPGGTYEAEAFFEYESGILTEKRPFRLGELVINIVDATRKLNRDSINQFNVIIESQWNDPIQNVYAEVNVFGQNVKFVTPSVRIEPFSQANLTGFFDTTGITDDSFNVNVRVFYEGKYSEKFVKLSFNDKINYIMIGGILAGAIFLIIIIILIVITIKLRRIKDEIGNKRKKK